MKFKYLASLLTVAAGLTAFSEAALADIVVKWQPGDNAANIQKAINTGDRQIIIPNVGKPWMIGQPIYARKSNQKITFKPGVTLLAQKGTFKNKFQSMITVEGNNVTLSGYKAQLKMRKQDYQKPNLYAKSEWRHNINIRGARNFVVEGFTLRDSGGDGLQITHGPSLPNQLPASKFSSGIVRDVIAVNNHRQGISIVSGQNVSVTNSKFNGSRGTNPASGVDLEPDHPWQKLVNIKFINNQFNNNQRNGIKIALWHYRGAGVSNVSITFDKSTSVGNGRYGIDIQGIDDGKYDGPRGNITFKNSKIAHSGEHGIFIRNDQMNPAKTFNVNFENTSVVNTAKKSVKFSPILLHNTVEAGGVPNINFGNNFMVQDNKSRPPLFATHFARVHGISNVHGNIRVQNPQKKPVDMGKNLKNVTLKFSN